MKCFERGVWGSIGGGSPLLKWMPLDWLQEDLSTPPTIGFAGGVGTRLKGDVLTDYRVRRRARGATRPAVSDVEANQTVGSGSCGNSMVHVRHLPTGCFSFFNLHYRCFVFHVSIHQGNGEFPDLIPTRQMCEK